MDRLKRIQPLRSQRQSLASDSLDPSSSLSNSTSSRVRKAASVLSLEEVLRGNDAKSKSKTSLVTTSEQDHPPVTVSRSYSHSQSAAPSAFAAPPPSASYSASGYPSQSRSRMTARSAEPDFGSTRALSRFLRGTGPDPLDEPPATARAASAAFEGADPDFPPTRSRRDSPAGSPDNQQHFTPSRAPVASADYFRNIEARIDQFDQSSVDGELKASSTHSKSIRKSRSIGESLGLRARPRSNSAAATQGSPRHVSNPNGTMGGPASSSVQHPGTISEHGNVGQGYGGGGAPASRSQSSLPLLNGNGTSQVNGPPALPRAPSRSQMQMRSPSNPAVNPDTFPVPSPSAAGAGNSDSLSLSSSRLRNLGGLATMLKRRKSTTAPPEDFVNDASLYLNQSTNNRSKKGGFGHAKAKRAGIGSDDFFIAPGELGQLQGSATATAEPALAASTPSKSSPFSFRRYANLQLGNSTTTAPPIISAPSPAPPLTSSISRDANVKNVLPPIFRSTPAPLSSGPPRSSVGQGQGNELFTLPVPTPMSSFRMGSPEPSSASSLHAHALRQSASFDQLGASSDHRLSPSESPSFRQRRVPVPKFEDGDDVTTDLADGEDGAADGQEAAYYPAPPPMINAIPPSKRNSRVSALFPAGLDVTVSSNGAVQHLHPVQSPASPEPSSFRHRRSGEYTDDDANSTGSGLRSMEVISIDGDLGEFRSSPVGSPVGSPEPDQRSFMVSPSTAQVIVQMNSASEEDAYTGMAHSPLDERASTRSLKSSGKKSSESKRSKASSRLKALAIDTGFAPLAPASGEYSGTSSSTTATSALSAALAFPLESIHGAGTSSSPPMSPPPDMPLPALPGHRLSSLVSGPVATTSVPPSSAALGTLADYSGPSASASFTPDASSTGHTVIPPSAFRLRARTLSPPKRLIPSHTPVSAVPSSATMFNGPSSTQVQVVALQNQVERLQAELGTTKQQMESMLRTVVEALQGAEAREKKLAERLEALERSVLPANISVVVPEGPEEAQTIEIPTPAVPLTAVEVPALPVEPDASSVPEAPPTITLPPSAPTPLILMQELSPPVGRPLRRSRTLPHNIFGSASHLIDVGTVVRPSVAGVNPRTRVVRSASEDGHATGTHVRSIRSARRKSAIRPSTGSVLAMRKSFRTRTRSRSRSRADEDGVHDEAATTLNDAYWALRPSPRRSATEPNSLSPLSVGVMEAELERRGTLSLITTGHSPRRKRVLPVLNGGIPSPIPSPLPSPNRSTSSHVANLGPPQIVTRKPTLSLGRNERLVALTASSAALRTPLPMFSRPTSLQTHQELDLSSPTSAERRASDNKEQEVVSPSPAVTSSTQTDSLAVPASPNGVRSPSARDSGSSSNNVPTSPTPSNGPSSPSFEQLVDLLEDLASKTPSVTRPSFESPRASVLEHDRSRHESFQAGVSGSPLRSSAE